MKTESSLWALVLLILSGCGTTLSTTSPGTLPTLIHGMPYYLPIGVITIKGEWKKPEKASEQEPGKEPCKEPGKDPGKQPGGTATGNVDLGSSLAFLTAASGRAPGKDSSPSSDSPTSGSVTIAVDNWTITISAESEADSEKLLHAIPRRNYIFDDDYHVTVNSKHLLSAGNTTAYDRTADIIGTVASLVSAVTKLATTAGEGAEVHLPFLVSFRTNNPKEYEDACKLLSSRSFDLKLDPLPEPDPKASSSDPERNVDGSLGLIFRLAKPYRALLRYPNPSYNVLSYNHSFLLPGLQNYVFDYRRMPFVKKLTEIGFTDGMLTDYRENLPSPILGFLGIPKAIVSALVPLPSASTPSSSSSVTGGTTPTP